MKTGKKVMILLLIFVAAVIVYFISPSLEERRAWNHGVHGDGESEISGTLCDDGRPGDGAGVRPDGGARCDRRPRQPDRTPGRTGNSRYGFAGTTKIQGLRYEIRSLDTEDLIERTQVTSLDAAINGDSENAVSAELLIQNLLETGKEYLLGVCASLPDGPRPGITCGSWRRTRAM